MWSSLLPPPRHATPLPQPACLPVAAHATHGVLTRHAGYPIRAGARPLYRAHAAWLFRKPGCGSLHLEQRSQARPVVGAPVRRVKRTATVSRCRGICVDAADLFAIPGRPASCGLFSSPRHPPVISQCEFLGLPSLIELKIVSPGLRGHRLDSAQSRGDIAPRRRIPRRPAGLFRSSAFLFALPVEERSDTVVHAIVEPSEASCGVA
jgi:hypothetical protein